MKTQALGLLPDRAFRDCEVEMGTVFAFFIGLFVGMLFGAMLVAVLVVGDDGE